MIAEILFWIAAALVVYAYAGYPLLLGVLAAIAPSPVRREERTPELSVIVPVHNQPDGAFTVGGVVQRKPALMLCRVASSSLVLKSQNRTALSPMIVTYARLAPTTKRLLGKICTHPMGAERPLKVCTQRPSVISHTLMTPSLLPDMSD